MFITSFLCIYHQFPVYLSPVSCVFITSFLCIYHQFSVFITSFLCLSLVSCVYHQFPVYLSPVSCVFITSFLCIYHQFPVYLSPVSCVSWERSVSHRISWPTPATTHISETHINSSLPSPPTANNTTGPWYPSPLQRPMMNPSMKDHSSRSFWIDSPTCWIR